MILLFAAAVMVILGFVLIRTILFLPDKNPPPVYRPEPVNIDQAVEKLSWAVKIPTLSVQDYSQMNPAPFWEFHSFLETAYPRVHRQLEKTTVNQFALVYKWQGCRKDLEPIALLAHMDVVPVEPETIEKWEFDPFGGDVFSDFIWGRGTMDMKGSLTAIMEAVEVLLSRKKTPDRTVYLLFGHDEESGGANGAAKIAQYLAKEGVALAYTVDEGMVVLSPSASPTGSELGIIGVGEKGYVSLQLNAHCQGGHSSSPPPETAIGKLCRAYDRLEKKPMPSRITPPVRVFFDTISKQMGFTRKIMFANQWLFSPVIRHLLGKSASTIPMVRTTGAPTIVQGGVKENILPTAAALTINFRILPGDTIEKIVRYVKKTINDPGVSVDLIPGVLTDPPPVSSIHSEGYKTVEKTLRQIFPNARSAPGLVWAMTDSRHYAAVSKDSYRFAPFRFAPSDLG